ncbi:hypothetical protein D3C73_1041700 [compost metagenome]
MAGANGAGVRDVFGKAGQDGLALFEQRRVATHQQIQPAFGGFLGRARHRRVQEAAAGIGHGLGHFHGGRRDGRRTVDDHGARAQALQHAAFGQQHGFHLRAAGHAQNDHIRLGRQRGAAFHAGRASGFQRIQGLIARMLKHGQRMTMLDQIACNAVAHEADSNHADFRHLPLLLPCVGVLWRKSYS